MPNKVIINVSDNKESRDFYLNKIVKELKKPIALCPGASPANGAKSKVIYTQNLSYSWLMNNLGEKTARDLIIEDVHKINNPTTLDVLLRFATDACLNVYLVGAIHNEKNGSNFFIDYLANQGYEISVLDDYVVEKDLSKKIDRAGLPKKITGSKFTADYLLDQADQLYKKTKTIIASNQQKLQGKKIEKTK